MPGTVMTISPELLQELRGVILKAQRTPIPVGLNWLTTGAPWPPRDYVTLEILNLLGSLDTGAAPVTAVYRPGATQEDNVYPTWAGALESLASAAGPRVLSVDDSLATAFVPAGTWDLTGIALTGRLTVGQTELHLLDGARLLNLNRIAQTLTLINDGSTPAVEATVSADIPIVILDTGATIVGAGAPVVNVPPGATFLVVMLIGGALGDGALPAISIEAGGAVLVLAAALSTVNGSSLTGAGIGFVQVVSTAANIDTSQPGLVTPLQLGTTIELVNQQRWLIPLGGDTANRPTGVLPTGYPYFDTDLGLPIWWNGSAWQDAAGNPV